MDSKTETFVMDGFGAVAKATCTRDDFYNPPRWVRGDQVTVGLDYDSHISGANPYHWSIRDSTNPIVMSWNMPLYMLKEVVKNVSSYGPYFEGVYDIQYYSIRKKVVTTTETEEVIDD